MYVNLQFEQGCSFETGFNKFQFRKSSYAKGTAGEIMIIGWPENCYFTSRNENYAKCLNENPTWF